MPAHRQAPQRGFDEEQRQKPERNIDPEDQRPVQMAGEEAAEQRAGDARRDEDRGEIGLIAAALARGDEIGDDRLRQRQEPAAAEPLQGAGNGERRHARRERAGDRAQDEDADADEQHDPAAVDVRELAVERRHRRRRDEIGRDDPGRIGEVAELEADRRQRRRDDRLIQRRKQHGETEPDESAAYFGRAGQGVGGHRSSRILEEGEVASCFAGSNRAKLWRFPPCAVRRAAPRPARETAPRRRSSDGARPRARSLARRVRRRFPASRPTATISSGRSRPMSALKSASPAARSAARWARLEKGASGACGCSGKTFHRKKFSSPAQRLPDDGRRALSERRPARRPLRPSGRSRRDAPRNAHRR